MRQIQFATAFACAGTLLMSAIPFLFVSHPSSQVLAKSMAKAAAAKPDYAGAWQGSLKVGNGMELPLVFHFQKAQGKYSGTLDSPMQGQTGIAIDTVVVDGGGKLTATIAKIHGTYVGTLNSAKKTIAGTWTQGVASFPLSLQSTQKYQGPNRPQEPKEPFPYKAEAVKIQNADVTLDGTLTIPEGQGPFPAVILIHGSGPNDRDETVFSHKPFLVLADYLTRKGIAVLRYDKRGTHKSTGNYKASTSVEFASDASKAFEYLKTRPDIDGKNIGLLGHSEGGVVAPMVAAQNDDVRFIVMMAGSVIPGDEILLSQVKALGKGAGESAAGIENDLAIARETYAIVKAEKDDNVAITKIKAMRKSLNAPEYKVTGKLKASDQSQLDGQLKMMVSPWYRFFISYDPRAALAKVHCPVLAINGDHDVQVDAQANLPEIKKALDAGGNKDVTEVTMPGLNHLFQTCKTGLPSEYSSIEETMSPKALQTIGDWITEHVKTKS